MTLEVAARAAGPIPLDLSLRLEAGEMLALVGPSGSGKTTVLRTIAGLWRPSVARVAVGGQVWLDTAAGVDLAPHRRRVGVVFQAYGLFPHLTAAGNVAAAMTDLPGVRRRAEAGRLLDLVHLGGLGGRHPADLSGGQQQRVALARALARRPEVLMLDEPFSAVDRATRAALHAEIHALRAHLAMPVILVTHDMAEAEHLADRIAVIEAGRLVAEGSVAAVMSDPAALRVMGLREAGATITARIAAQEGDGLTRLDSAAGPLWLPRIDGPAGAAVGLRILAHEVILSRARPEGLSALNVLAARVVAIIPGEGPGAVVRLALGAGERGAQAGGPEVGGAGEEILARVTRRSVAALGLAPGVACHAIVKSMSVGRDRIDMVTGNAGAAGAADRQEGDRDDR
ncbi:MAG: molybdenum ABC transporter ATP-binding protein [Alphaproteobacteria bacterium HGW-Alphaproteobacteria-6]|nr:MAG: molybdenum ABC transporter ATP-binding protein [Alphaproteobacteria bacterium HGW-Alphaproteobacteria-6]